ncbi:MAG: OmpA family protein [Thioalkalispiraceae bacterium]|jgi:outer membrane protein OmpA-like peptidoglycan-associated protein
MKLSKLRTSVIALIVLCFGLASCTTDEYGNRRPMTDAEKGALIGAGIGVLAGLTTKNKKKKAILYGVVGGIAGGAIGTYMDNQQKDFEKQLADQIQTGAISVTRLPNDVLMVTMTAQTAFDFDSTNIKPGFQPSMDKIAQIVKKYGKTHLSLVGHTDSTGSHTYNQGLSERRAQSVHDYLRQQGVIPQRLAYYGMGEEQPRADNATARGRTLNRRVEIIIEPIREGAQY